MIVLDTSVLLYAVGAEHALREPSRRVVDAIGAGRLQATTTVEAIQECVHVRARRHGRVDAVRIGRKYQELLSPLLVPDEEDLERGLRLFEAHRQLGAFDAVLAATAIARGADALVSADRDFAVVPMLRYVDPASADLDALIGT